jgi:hypothetical protein
MSSESSSGSPLFSYGCEGVKYVITSSDKKTGSSGSTELYYDACSGLRLVVEPVAVISCSWVDQVQDKDKSDENESEATPAQPPSQP